MKEGKKEAWWVDGLATGWGILQVLEGPPPGSGTRGGHSWPFPVPCAPVHRRGTCHKDTEDPTGPQGGRADQAGRFCSRETTPKVTAQNRSGGTRLLGG